MPLFDLSIDNYKYAKSELKLSNSWMSFKSGDIFKRTDINMLIHQANCFNIMNAGVAYYIHKYYPTVFSIDNSTGIGEKNKLGYFSCSLETNINDKSKDLLIYNIYSQYRPGSMNQTNGDFDSADNRYNYLTEALTHVLESIKIFNLDTKTSQYFYIGVPWLIGCGIAGGNIDRVFNIFKSIFKDASTYCQIVFVDIKGEDEYK